MGTHPIFESDFDCLTDGNTKLWLLLTLVNASDDATAPCYPCKETNQVSCDCSNMDWGSSFEKKLQSMNPPSWFTANTAPNAIDLTLDHNAIGVVTASLFDETKWANKEIVMNMRTLNMNNCNITAIEPRSLEDLGKMTIITLDHNQLESLDEDIFDVQRPTMARVYVRYNRLTSIPKRLFRNMDDLQDLRLSSNALIDVDRLAFENTGKLHALYMDSNHLTQIHKDWFDTFHENWKNGDQTQHGQVFLNGNPWVCDCTTQPFVTWIDSHPFFEEHYDSSQHSYVQMGTCKYPSNLRSRNFKGLSDYQLTCSTPSKFSTSNHESEMSIGDDAFELSVTAVGRPVPKVVWSYKHVNQSEIENTVDCVEWRVEAPEHIDNLDSYPLTHYMRPNQCTTPPSAFGEYTFVARLIGLNSDGMTTSVPIEFAVTVGRDTTFWKICIVTIILTMSFLICWRYRDSLRDTFTAMRGNKQVGMPAYAYQNVSTDQDALINNEESERAYTPEKEMKINV